MDNKIIISVAMIAYCHEKYISQALDSILMQENDYRLEIVIGDDCSSDNTQNIIREYERKYPGIITAVLRNQNIGASNNIIDILGRCKGKYLIMLDGDDYWIDSRKLSIQADFLEKHPEYIGVSHWCEVVNENDEISDEFPKKYEVFNMEKHVYSIEDFKKFKVPGHLTTLMFRNIFLDTKYDSLSMLKSDPILCDRTLYLLLTLKGNIYCMHKIMSHYRFVCKEGGTNYCSKISGRNNQFNEYRYISNLEKYSFDLFGIDISFTDIKSEIILRSIKALLKHFSVVNFNVLRKILSIERSRLKILLYSCFKFFQKAAFKIKQGIIGLFRRG